MSAFGHISPQPVSYNRPQGFADTSSPFDARLFHEEPGCCYRANRPNDQPREPDTRAGNPLPTHFPARDSESDTMRTRSTMTTLGLLTVGALVGWLTGQYPAPV